MDDDKREAASVSFAQALRNLRDNLPALMEMDAINAKLTRKKYLALVGEGFTEQQALELCRKA